MYWCLKSTKPMRCRLSGPSVPGLELPATSPSVRPSSDAGRRPITTSPAQCAGEKVYLYEADLTSDTVRRKVSKHCFKTKPWEFLKVGSDGSLPLEIQAAYQAVRPILSSLRESRMTITRSMTEGSKTWHRSYARLRSYGESLHESDMPVIYRRIITRYYKFCMSEIIFCRRQLIRILGAMPDKMTDCCLIGDRIKPSLLMKVTSQGT